MFIMRWVLGRIIWGVNFIFSPRSQKRDVESQKIINEKTQYLSLYQLPACPFCVKVRRTMKREGLEIDIRSIKKDEHRNELVSEGGKHTFPCLKISTLMKFN